MEQQLLFLLCSYLNHLMTPIPTANGAAASRKKLWWWFSGSVWTKLNICNIGDQTGEHGKWLDCVGLCPIYIFFTLFTEIKQHFPFLTFHKWANSGEEHRLVLRLGWSKEFFQKMLFSSLCLGCSYNNYLVSSVKFLQFSNLSTNQACLWLASEIRWDWIHSVKYGCRQISSVLNVDHLS